MSIRPTMVAVLAVMILVFCFAGAADAAVRWEVLESTESILRLRLETEGARLVTVEAPEAQAEPWSRVVLEGAYEGGEPGLPLLPAVARWVALPPEGEAEIRVDILERRSLGRARLLPHPTPFFDDDALPGDLQLMESTLEGEGYSRFRAPASRSIRLDEPVFQRRHRMAALQFLPVIHDAATGQVEVIESAEVEIRFPRARALQSDVSGVGTPAQVLNPEQGALWRCLPPKLRAQRDVWQGRGGPQVERAKASGVGVFDRTALQGNEVRIRVEDTGMTRVNVSQLIDAGVASGVSRRNLRLYQRRASDPLSPDYPAPLVADVPFVFLGTVDPDSTLSPDDVIAFHAFSAQDDWEERTIDGDPWPLAMPQRPDHFNSANVYFLSTMTPGAEPWARMPEESLGASQGSPQPSFLQSQVFSDDAGYKDNPNDSTVERFFWNEGLDRTVTRSLPLLFPVPGGNLSVTWNLTRRSVDNLTVEFRLQKDGSQWPLGSVLMTSAYNGLVERNAVLPTDPIGSGFVQFVMDRIVNGNPSSVNAYLGQVAFEYRAEYRADFNEIEFHTDVEGVDVDIEVGGFSDTQLALFDITDPRAPRRVILSAANLVDEGDGTHTLSLRVPQAAGEQRKFLATRRTNLELVRSSETESDTVIDLYDVAPAAQVLAVGPEEYRAATQRWVDWRQANNAYGWDVSYADLQQIYDQFSGGLQAPIAIKRYAEYAYLQWDAAALVLVGDANEDARGVTPLAGPNLAVANFHLQEFLSSRELLVSDKWFAIFQDFPIFPTGLNVTSDMMVGRFPVSSTGELSSLIDKIIAYEQPREDDEWRSRTLWVSDDAYSTDYLGGAAQACYSLSSGELAFESSQNRNSDVVNAALDGVMSGETYDTEDATVNCRANVACEDLSAVSQCLGNQPNGPTFLQNQLGQGWLAVSYQGHANFRQLGHENILTRGAIASLSNDGRPFLFFGMGCHVTDFVQAREGSGQPAAFGRSMGEELLLLDDGGAIVTYGSSGFEFLNANKSFMEIITDTIFDTGRTAGPISNVSPLVTPWIAGEVLAQAEITTLGTPGIGRKDEMVSQYNLLGDPTLRMDAAPPRMAARAGTQTLTEGTAIVADAGSSTLGLQFDLVDETGIQRLQIEDSLGRDYSSAVALDAIVDPRSRTGSIALTVYPQTYTVQIEAYDGSYPQERPTSLSLSVAVDKDVTIDGISRDETEVIVPTDRSVPVVVELVTPVDLNPLEIGVSMEGGSTSNLSVSGTGREWTLRFDAQATTETAQALLFELQPGVVEREELVGESPDLLALGTHYPVPNPSRGNQPINIVVQANDSVERARLTVYDLSGRTVFARDIAVQAEQAVGEGVRFVVQWDGRDESGDDVANGTYLYRVEARRGGDSARTEMGRLVMMR